MKEKTIAFSSAIRLNPEDSGYQHCIARFNNHLIDSKRKDRNKLFRRQAVMIINIANGNKILRYAMGQASYSGLTKSTIGIDYDGIDMLAIKYHEEEKIEVRPATLIEMYAWLRNHPDINVRIPYHLGLAGLFLGLIGFAVGILPILIK